MQYLVYNAETEEWESATADEAAELLEAGGIETAEDLALLCEFLGIDAPASAWGGRDTAGA